MKILERRRSLSLCLCLSVSLFLSLLFFSTAFLNVNLWRNGMLVVGETGMCSAISKRNTLILAQAHETQALRLPLSKINPVFHWGAGVVEHQCGQDNLAWSY